MSDLSSFSDGAFLEHVVAVNAEFRRRFGKELGITGAYGEVNCALLWGMTRALSHIQEGYDCTIGSCRIEVKCGVNRAPNDSTSKISEHPFDQLLYVHYDENYRIIEAYTLSNADVERILSKKDGRVLRLREVRQFGKRVQPGTPLLE